MKNTWRWGLPQAGLLPRATDIHVRYGKPVDVGAAEAEPSDARVEEVFTRCARAGLHGLATGRNLHIFHSTLCNTPSTL